MQDLSKRNKSVNIWTKEKLKEFLNQFHDGQDEFEELAKLIRKVDIIYYDRCPYSSEILYQNCIMWDQCSQELNNRIHDASQEI